ncbi:ankyrin repeat domain-containing protein [Sulfurovum sp.]|uniref:ankyrin repeat domain-containing protein n=1 Tax=Sulfurovum sp. TaxID=1969726 RepID=UPI0025FE7307|nr:ankyrin repeat domain-containing protein [Sulfurovum sp.]
MFILQAISTKIVPVFMRLFVLMLILQLAVPVPVLSQADTTGLQDMSEGLDDFAPDQPEKSLNTLVSDDIKPTQTALATTTTTPKTSATATKPKTSTITTTPKVASTVSIPSVPSNWQHYSVAGLSVSVPPDWTVIEKDYDNLQIGNLDKATRKGVMLMIGTQRKNPLDEKMPKEMQITILENKELAGHMFAQEIMQADLPQAKVYTHMFFSKKPYIKTKYSNNFLVVTLGATNLDPTDYKKIFVTILNSIKASTPEKLTEPQSAAMGFVTFTLPVGWEVLQDAQEYLTLRVAGSYVAYLGIKTGDYAVFNTTDPGKSTTILGQPAQLHTGETNITVVSNGIGANARAVVRTYVLTSCTADGAPIMVEETATLDWLKSTGFETLEKAIEMSLPKGAKSCTLDSKPTQNQMSQGESTDKYNRSMLHKAVLQGDLEKIKYLLSSGKDVNTKDKLSRTPLHYAAIKGYVEIAKILLNNGADINAVDKAKQWTPLFYAAYMHHKKMVDFLIKEGADQTLKDKLNRTASDYIKD